MKSNKRKSRWRSIVSWILWVLLVQFILVNISAALYAYKLTHLHTTNEETSQKKSSNIFSKTWRLFTGPAFYRQPLNRKPPFNYSTVELVTKSGVNIKGWYGKTDSAARGTVILIHGLTSNKGQVLDEATAFLSIGFNVFLLDVRSHGNSSGAVTTIGYREAEEVMLAYEQVRKQGEKSVFLWGTSMGAVAIIKAVSDYNLELSGIIIEMPFLSLQAHLAGRARILGFPEQPFGLFTTFWIGVERGFNGYGFRTNKYARDISCPVLMQYGKKDELVLEYETTAIFEAIGSTNKKLVEYENAHHESFFRHDPVLWKKEIMQFLTGSGEIIF